MFISRPSLMLVALASGATQFVTYGMINFAVLFLMREKGMTLKQIAVYYALVVAIGMTGKHARLRAGDRPFHAALETGLCVGARRLANSCPAVLSRICLGSLLASRRCSSSRARCF
jgi:hypothetical protein